MSEDSQHISKLIAQSTQVSEPEAIYYKGAKKEEESMFYQPQNMAEFTEWERLSISKKDSISERQLRERYAHKSYIFSLCWASFIAALILLKGFGKKIGFNLSTTEFLSVIGALSATILAYYTFVVRYFFTRSQKPTG